MQQGSVIKSEAGQGDPAATGVIGRTLATDLNVPAKSRDAWLEGWAMCALWILHLDPKSVEAQVAKENERKAAEKAAKEKKAVERDTAKAAAAKEAIAAAETAKVPA
jgi:hypothetical protein